MPKNSISEYDAIPANNTDVGGTSLVEQGMRIKDTNDSFRILMSHLKKRDNEIQSSIQQAGINATIDWLVTDQTSANYIANKPQWNTDIFPANTDYKHQAFANTADKNAATKSPGQILHNFQKGGSEQVELSFVDESSVERTLASVHNLGARNAINFAKLSGLPDGTERLIGGLPYVSDSTKTGTASAANDLGVDGVDAAGAFLSPSHYGSVGDGTTIDTTAFERAIAAAPGKNSKIFVFGGDYPIQLDVTLPDIEIVCLGKVVLRAATSGILIDVKSTATGFKFNGSGVRMSGQTKAQEDATATACTALHCIRVDAENVTLSGFKAGAARNDGLYCAVDSRKANLRCFDYEFTDTSRNGISIVDGDGYLFEHGQVWNDGSHESAGLRNNSLFSHEPNPGQVSRRITFRDTIFTSGTPTAGGHAVIISDPNDGSNDVYAIFEDCRFLKAASNPSGDPILSPANLRGTGNPTHISIRDCYFEDRVFANVSTQVLSHTHLENVQIGTLNIIFDGSFDDTCSIRNLQSDIAGNVVYPVDANTLVVNSQGYVAPTTTPTVQRYTKVISLADTSLTDILQLGTRGAFEVRVKAGTTRSGGYVHSSFSEASVSNNFTENASTRSLHNSLTGLDVQWASTSGFSADARKLQVQALDANMDVIIVEVTVFTNNPNQSTVTWLA